jgi:PIN domain nuclease of toxin-antitoxin system
LGFNTVIVLDTHALLWWADNSSELGRKARAAIESERDGGQILVSAISAWEIAALAQRERIVLTMDPASWFATLVRIDSVRIVPVDVEIGIKAVGLPGEFHKDPADRIIVATARKFSAPLATKDEKIRAYPHVKTIW